MKIEEDAAKPIVTRLKRAHGHLATVIRMLEEGQDCEDVLTQLAAVNKALGRSGYALVATGLQQCIAEEGPENVDQQKLEKLFLALA
ncbi:metal-sensitive transcriptional regulator [Gordonia sp. CPCC 206044]|uniref:metal-sensitive transcriptional regulator n=1 Tax=Gordonia sp. CPCC 206044 TaxID=3140793 RepID=UPI003AF388C8